MPDRSELKHRRPPPAAAALFPSGSGSSSAAKGDDGGGAATTTTTDDAASPSPSSSSGRGGEEEKRGGRRKSKKMSSSSFAAVATYLAVISIVASLFAAVRLVVVVATDRRGGRRDRRRGDRLRGGTRRDDGDGGEKRIAKTKTSAEVFVGIKTDASGAHGARVPEIRATWLRDATRLGVDVKFFAGRRRKKTKGIEDANDEEAKEDEDEEEEYVVNTDCDDGYGGSITLGSDDLGYNLCCKNQAMYRHFLRRYYGVDEDGTSDGGRSGSGAADEDAKKKEAATATASPSSSWFCSFDDDNYVLVENLLRVLAVYETHRRPDVDDGEGEGGGPPLAARDAYVGRPSVQGGITVPHLHNLTVEFLTGGAGYCLSSDVILRGQSDFLEFERFCRRYRVPDDVAVGHLVSNVLNVNVTTNELFHSHYETHTRNGMDLTEVGKQVSFGYDNKMRRGEGGTLKSFPAVPVLYSIEEDPMLFRSLRSFLSREKNDEKERSTLERWRWRVECRAKDLWYRVLRPKMIAS